MATINGTINDDLIQTASAGGSDGGLPDASDTGDTILGDAGDDVILAGAGDDVIDGGEGSDTLAGGPGGDLLQPGAPGVAGPDNVDGGGGQDTLVLRGNPGDYNYAINPATLVVYITGSGGVANEEVYVAGVETVAFGITAQDLAAGLRPSATVALDLLSAGTNRAPVALNDTIMATIGATQLVIDARDVFGNDFDFEGDPFNDPLYWNIQPSPAVAAFQALGAANEIANAGYDPSLYPAGLLLLDLAMPLAADTELFTYALADDQNASFGNLAAVRVQAVPPLGGDDAYRGTIGGSDYLYAADLLANDGAGASLVGLVGASLIGNTHVVYQPGQTGSFGGVSIQFDASTGIVRTYNDFTTAGSFSFDYLVEDAQGNTDTATVTITVDNRAPVAVAQSFAVASGSSITVDWSDIVFAPGNSDPDGDDFILAFYTFLDPALGSIQGFGPADPNDPTDFGGFTYTPAAGFSGTASITYGIQDQPDLGGALRDSPYASALLSFVVGAAPNLPPVASDLTIAETEDFPGLLFSLAAQTSDPDSNATAWAITTVVGGTVTGFDPTSGLGSFVPTADFNGQARIDWSVTDAGGLSDSASIFLDIAPVNDAPVAVSDAYSVQEGGVLTVAAPGLLANDSDADGTAPTAFQFFQPANGTVSLVQDGSFTYTPNAGFSGSDSFQYFITDGVATASASVAITVTEGSPVAVADSYTVLHDQVLSVAGPGLLANDIDPNGDVLTAFQFFQPANGAVSLVQDGSFTYTPNAGFVGTDSFVYVVTDGANTAQGTVGITVRNDAPVAADDSFSVQEGRVLTIAAPGLLANDSDADGDVVSAFQFFQPANGTVSLVQDGSFTYTPNAGFSGSDSFVYVITDGIATAQATASVAVIEGTPIAGNDSYTVAAGSTLTIAAPGLLANDADPNGDAVSAFQFFQPANGTVSLIQDGSFTYIPNAGFVGTDSFTYVITDGVLTGSGTVGITVTPNTAPVASDLTLNDNEDYAGSLFSLAGLTSDPDNNATLWAIAGVLGGSITGFDPASGLGSFVSAADFNGQARIDWTVTDADGLSDSASIFINLAPVNDAPTELTLSAATIAENSAIGRVVGTLSASDVDGDALTYAIQGASPFAIVGNALRVAAPIDFETTPVLPVNVRVSDGQGGVLDRAFSITVTDVMEGSGPVPIPPGFGFSSGSQGLGQGPGGPITTQGIATSVTNGAFLIEATGVWNGVKNAFTSVDAWNAALGQSITVANFVDVRLDLDNAGTTLLALTVIGVKRGDIATAGGDDTVGLVFHSNEGVWNNTLRLATDGGNDTVSAGTVAGSMLDEALLADNAAPANGPFWNAAYDGRFSVLDVDLGDGNDSVTATDVRLQAQGGAGNDVLAGGRRNDVLTGGAGNDMISGGLGADRFVFDGDDGGDVIADFNTAQGDKVVLGGPGALALSGSVFAFGSTTAEAGNGHVWTIADFIFV